MDINKRGARKICIIFVYFVIKTFMGWTKYRRVGRSIEKNQSFRDTPTTLSPERMLKEVTGNPIA